MLLNIILATLTLCYPAAVYFGLQHFNPQQMAALLLTLAVIRFMSLGKSPINHWAWPPLILVLALWSLSSNSDMGLKLYPVLMNISFFIVFAWSLRVGPPIVERLARLTEPELPESAIAYTRRVTGAWCLFFIVNGAIALYTVWLQNAEIWALYNGFISYLLMGVFFAVEWLIRQKVKARNHD